MYNQVVFSVDFICCVWELLLVRMGISQCIMLIKYGFYLVGGGVVVMVVELVMFLCGLMLILCGEMLCIIVEVLLVVVFYYVGECEVVMLEVYFLQVEKNVVVLEGGCGLGNVLLLMI